MENGDGLLKLPDEIVDKFQFKEGDKVELISLDGSILVRPLKNEYKLDKLLDGINDNNLQDEIDFGKTEGEE